MPVCIFYLTLRGLDTIEDDTSIPLATKEPLLRDFKDFLEQDGWTFTGNRPEEKDRELLVQFHNVVAEFNNLKPAYREIIKDITNKMGNGMADYCRKAELDDASVKTVAEYDEYCFYVAGLVGEGLTRLFIEAQLGNAALLERTRLHKSMGLFLQKTNIIRDVHEDNDDGRRFWPQEIWSKHVNDFEDLFKPEHRDAALNCSSEMVLNALEHVEDCLFYLAGLREQSVFNFCAIPQSMAIATLELCFRNPAIFERNIKITKGEACGLMMQSTQNLQIVYKAFRVYARKIHKKNTPKDPNFLKISLLCGRVRATSLCKSPISNTDLSYRLRSLLKISSRAKTSRTQSARWLALCRRRRKRRPRRKAKHVKMSSWSWPSCLSWLWLSRVSWFVGPISLLKARTNTDDFAQMGVAWYLGARFDLAWQEIKQGNFKPPTNRFGNDEL